MIFLLLVYILYKSGFGDATLISSIQQRDGDSCGESNNNRTTWNIIWSCSSTLFFCTWITIHPNIAFTPERRGMGWREEWLWEPLRSFRKYKLPLFLWALIFPEWILAWAVRQWIMAGRIGKRGGTRTHGLFVIMGGFHLFQRSPLASKDDETPTARTTREMLRGNLDTHAPFRNPREDEIPVHPLGIEDLPEDIIIPTEKEIKDRGKSDALAKIIVLVQTLWFITQCIARGIKHLHLTELEIVTLAYTMMDFVIYVFWWHNPRDVGCPIQVYKKSRANTAIVSKMPNETSLKMLYYIQGIEGKMVGLSDERSVPMFWSGMSPGIDSDGDLLISMASNLGPTIFGVAFGATHFIAWLYGFSSYAELILWRISCVTMVAVPVMSTLGCVGALGSGTLDVFRNKDFNTTNVLESFLYIALFLGVLAVFFGAWLYLFAQIVTIVVAFTTLRSLPVDAFKIVDWTTFIPHI